LSPRPDVSEERKKQILDAAISVFSRLGFHKARMDDIVKESGLSKGTLYWYFESKDEIITSIMEDIFTGSMEEYQLHAAPGTSVREQLTKIMINTMDDVKQMLQIRPLVYEFFALAFRDEKVQKLIRNYFKFYMDNIVPIVQKGIDNGEFRKMDAREASMSLGAIFEGTILLWFYDPSIVEIEQQLKASLDLLLDGFEAKPGDNNARKIQ
jgi:AcrR family transcriptional regulator